MLRKIATGIILTILLTIMLPSAFNIQQAEASGTIYIRADGSIDPPTASIFTPDNINYIFTDNITDYIVVERSNTILDGNGFTLQGPGSGIGLHLGNVNGSIIHSINIRGFDYGIYLSSSSENRITRNNISNCAQYGIGVYRSSRNTISYNNITENVSYGYPSNIGGGIQLAGSSENKIVKNILKDNGSCGIVLSGGGTNWDSRFNDIYENNITGTRNYCGVYLYYVDRNSVFRNSMTNNSIAIMGYVALNSSINENRIENNDDGIVLTHSSCYNTVQENTVINNTCGIRVISTYLAASVSNYISGNEIRQNDYGLYSTGSSSHICHNNFVDNTQQVLYGGGLDNAWDDGYPSGGNYWSNHDCTDLFKGPYQNETGSDCIGDTPYFIGGTEQDNYPLMNLWSPLPNNKPVVVLVHGFQLFGTDPDVVWEDMNKTLSESGFDVMISHYAGDYPLILPTGKDIKGYAEKLSQEIQGLKSQTGASKVDIVAHSMGGLVARYYVEKCGGAANVGKLIMLGTPNHGTEIAYLAFTSLYLLARVYVSAYIIDPGLASMIVENLQSPFEMIPNSPFLNALNHGAPWVFVGEDQIRPDVKYYTIAGTRPRGLYWITWHILKCFSGENDGVVREKSVKLYTSLPYEHYTYSIDHSSLKEDPSVIDRVAQILGDDTSLDQNYETQVTSSQTEDESIEQAPLVSGKILPSEEKSYELLVSSTSELSIIMSWPYGHLNLTLTTPSGALIDPSFASSSPNVTFYNDENLKIKGYNITSPETGIWEVHVTAANITSEQEFTVITFFDTDIRLASELQQYEFDPNEPIQIKASLTCANGTMTDVSVSSTILKPDTTTETLMLYDDGLHNDNQTNDGIYGNNYTNTSLCGTYYITVTAHGKVDNQQFARETYDVVWVQVYPDLCVQESDIHFSEETPLEGETITINATIHNIGGEHADSVSVLFYDGNPVDGVLIGKCIINIPLNEARNASIQWNATRGQHQICVLVSPYNGFLEADYSNNSANKTIEVRMTGDVNGDGKVEVYDLFDFGKAYGCASGDPNWNHHCDFNFDNIISSSDLEKLQENYGKIDP